MIEIAKTPAIQATFSLIDGRVVAVQLSLSSAFRVVADGALPPALLNWLSAYAKGAESPLPPMQFQGSPFQRKVWLALQTIPRGQTRSYGELAEVCESPAAYRAAGGACGKNPLPLLIPCHRVIGAKGKLGGFSCGLEIKKRLLAFEKAFA